MVNVVQCARVIAAAGLLSFAGVATLLASSPETIMQIQTARTAFDAGAYEAALGDLSGQIDAGSLTLQAEIMSAQIMLGRAENPHELALQARRLAGQALALDPQNTEAKIQYALASGFEARTAGVFKAWRKKLPQKCKTAIDEAYAAAPDDPRTLALQGAWHLGLVRKAGAKRAKSMFGASEQDGLAWYDAAVARAPDDIVILGNYAFALLGIDASRHKGKALALIQMSDAAAADTAIRKEVQNNMHSVLKVLDDPDALAARIDALMNDAG